MGVGLFCIFISSSSVVSWHSLTYCGGLMGQDGVWEGERILPEGWVAYSTTPTHAASFYGAGWWLGYPGGLRKPAPLLWEDAQSACPASCANVDVWH